MPRYRHIVHTANGQLWMQFPPKTGRPKLRVRSGLPILIRHAIRACEDANLMTIAALHQGNYATIANYLERELRYMDAGE
jgi:hypothetical protein